MKYPQAGVGGIARQQDNLDPVALGFTAIQREKLLYQSESDARLQHFLFVVALVGMIGRHPLFLEHPVGCFEVKQGTR